MSRVRKGWRVAIVLAAGAVILASCGITGPFSGATSLERMPALSFDVPLTAVSCTLNDVCVAIGSSSSGDGADLGGRVRHAPRSLAQSLIALNDINLANDRRLFRFGVPHRRFQSRARRAVALQQSRKLADLPHSSGAGNRRQFAHVQRLDLWPHRRRARWSAENQPELRRRHDLVDARATSLCQE